MTIRRKISLRLLEREAKRLAARDVPHKADYKDFSEIKEVLLLFECRDAKDWDAVIRIVDNLEQERRAVSVFAYCQRLQDINRSDPRVHLFDKSGVSFWGRPDESLLHNVENKAYDAVFDLTPELCFPLRYMLLRAATPLRCGGDNAPTEHYDFKIVVDASRRDADAPQKTDDITYLYQQMAHYLEMIRAKS